MSKVLDQALWGVRVAAYVRVSESFASVGKEKNNVYFNTNHICTPECQEATPPCFLCTGYEVQLIVATGIVSNS